MENKKNSSGEQLKESLNYTIRHTFWEYTKAKLVSDERMEEYLQKVNNLILKKYQETKINPIYLTVKEIANKIGKAHILRPQVDAILNDEVINKNLEERTIDIYDFYESKNKRI